MCETDWEQVVGLIGQLNQEKIERLCWSYSYSAAEAIALGHDMIGHLSDILVDLLPIYRFVCWTRDNDHLSLKAELQADKIKRKSAQVPVEVGDRVLITAGLFQGKRGRVQEIDKKGVAHVLVGKLVLQINGRSVRKLQARS